MKLRPGRIVVACLGICATSALPTAWSQAKKGVPTWAPTEGRLKQLPDELKSDGWAMRPPRDCQNRVTKDPNETRTVWGKKDVGLIVTKAVVPFDELDLERALTVDLTLLRGRFRNLNNTPPEQGLINGKTFIRTRFSAEDIPNVTGKGFGFIYLTIEGKTHFIITGFGSAATVEDLEASAQTFRILK